LQSGGINVLWAASMPVALWAGAAWLPYPHHPQCETIPILERFYTRGDFQHRIAIANREA
jgi:hypothetical protein